MSRRPPLIAVAMAIALLAGLTATGAPISHGSRSQQARAADGALKVAGSVRSRSAPARRDRASLGTYSVIAPSSVELEPPSRVPIDLEVLAIATAVPERDLVRPRSRAPPRS